MTESLTAIVLNWRTAQLALSARASLLADGVPAERVLLVDNGSADGSTEVLAAQAPDSPLLALDPGLGFAAANNRAAARLPAGGCYLFVNADARVHRPGTVAALHACVARPGVAIAVPRLRNPDLSLQPSVVPLAAPLPELIRASGLSRWVPDRWQPSLGTHWEHGSSREIQAADGPVLAVDAAAFAGVGGFDERTFMYGEDHALFRALGRKGGAAWFVAEAEFVHVGAAASTQRWGAPARARRIAYAEAALLLHPEPAAAGHAPARPPIAARVALAAMTLGAGARALARRALGDHAAAAVHAAQLRGYRAAAASPGAARGIAGLKCGGGPADWT